ncbi:hypothetical protein BXT86_02750 [candidate division WOR-3 bacterium 4484_100]|uniref:DUF5683 domain-containing protein n=1 Tax=candidate division WOR-3 bacterium 4484_100 TaxID=1936077 RepID=A0A1V4QGL3_UNCW3|nr:MAG: hypothetical protein BXT86_02750 [candidate division WOR-3 bacterium 4484_100]
MKKTIYSIIILLIFTNLAGARTKNAGLAMLLCTVPGGGQFYTERYLPGILIAGTEITLGYYAYKYHQEGDYEKRNSFLWWELFVFGYSLADAYVGAKMFGFDVEADLEQVSINFRVRW